MLNASESATLAEAGVRASALYWALSGTAGGGTAALLQNAERDTEPTMWPQEAGVASCGARKTALPTCVEAAAGGTAQREGEEREGGSTEEHQVEPVVVELELELPDLARVG